jgi:hypothetical protein
MACQQGAQRRSGCSVAAQPVRMVFDGMPGSGCEVRPRIARPGPGRRLRIQLQVLQDLLDHRQLVNGRDDLQFAGAAVRTLLHTDVCPLLRAFLQVPVCGVGRQLRGGRIREAHVSSGSTRVGGDLGQRTFDLLHG